MGRFKENNQENLSFVKQSTLRTADPPHLCGFDGSRFADVERKQKCHGELDSWSRCTLRCVIRLIWNSRWKDWNRRNEIDLSTVFRHEQISRGHLLKNRAVEEPSAERQCIVCVDGLQNVLLEERWDCVEKVHDVEVAKVGRFRFELQGRVVEYGKTEFCLITSLRFGSYVDIINTKVSTSSALRNRLFPNVRDEDLRLKDLEDYIKWSAFSMCSDEDAVMVMQMVFLLTSLIGRNDNTCIPPTVYELADSQYNWNRFVWGAYLWSYSETQLRLGFGQIYRYLRDNESVGYVKMMKYTMTSFQLSAKVWILETFPEALRFAHQTENEIPRMRAWRIKTQLSLEQCLHILDVLVVPSTEPLKNRNGKKPQKSNNVAKRPLLFDSYVDCDDEFWKLWGKNMGAIFVEHRLLRGIEMNCEFCSSLLGFGSRWLLYEEINSSTGRWALINPKGTTVELGKQHYLRRVAIGMVDGPHWKDINRLLQIEAQQPNLFDLLETHGSLPEVIIFVSAFLTSTPSSKS
ncbi:unnamed protein product [Lactuca saligna]|uniref:DUF1985 domain-containing protein n=1 Tax=Lactuca saligna TaxID=75948 RepID=A0AA35ZPR3_LACSI|nr:unnamed protein product [Lactuca saligna]